MAEGPQAPVSSILALERARLLHGDAKAKPVTVGHSKARIVVDEENGFYLTPKGARATGPREDWTR